MDTIGWTEIIVLWASLTYVAYRLLRNNNASENVSKKSGKVKVVVKNSNAEPDFDKIINSDEYKVKGKFEMSK